MARKRTIPNPDIADPEVMKALKGEPRERLTERMDKFCHQFLLHGDPVKAMLEAGYERPPEVLHLEAKNMLENPRIKKRLEELNERAADRIDMTRDRYHKKLLETYEAAMDDSDYAGANRAMELLGKSLGYFVEQKMVLGVNASLNLSKEERLKRISHLAKIVGVELEPPRGE